MTLSYLKLYNFQCHSKLVIELDPYCTSIVGPSNRGKSAVLRAFNWLTTNKSRGSSFIKKDQDTCKVVLGIDGHKLIRRKSPGENVYQFDREKPSEAVGANVPEELQKLLNVDVLNYQSQHKSLFWFDLTAGAVSKELNAIIDLSTIDETLARAATASKTTKTAINFSQERLDGFQKELESLSWVSAYCTTVNELRIKQEQIASDHVKHLRAADLIERVLKADLAQERRADAIKRAARLVTKGSKLLELGTKTRNLKKVIEGITKYQVKLNVTIPSYTTIQTLSEKVEGLRNKKQRLISLLGNLKKAEDSLCLRLSTLNTNQEELQQKTQGICPICSNPLPPKSIKM